MTEILRELLVERLAYVLTVVLMMIGLYGMLVKSNLIKKLIGMNIFQGGIILFFVVFSYKENASVPYYDATIATEASGYLNPIPHGLMLTAIVVLVATSAVGLGLLVRVYQEWGTLEEGEVLAEMRKAREE